MTKLARVSSNALDHLMRDTRVAMRGLRRTPTFAITAILILGLGIGMASAMSTVFRSVLLRRLPVRDQDRIVTLFARNDGGELDVNRSDLAQFSPESRTIAEFASVAHWGAFAFELADGQRSVVMNQAQVTGNFFSMLGVRPVLGRLFRAGDDVMGAAHVMVISWDAWQREFGGDTAVIGRHLAAPNLGWEYTVVGVAPPGLDYPSGTDYWVPIVPLGTQTVIAVGRLARGATIATARSEFMAAMQRLQPARHITGADVRTLTQDVLGNVRPALIALTAAVALLLLIACVNVGNLLLLRAAGRARELAVRRALGARYGDVVRQLAVESALLGVAGGALGLFCADTALHVLLALAPAQLPRMDLVRLAGAPIGLTIGVTLLAVAMFGVVPALLAARGELAQSLRLDARSGGESRARHVVRQSLVATQIALAVVMLAGAGLVTRTLERLQRLDLGYNPDHVTMLQFSIPFTPGHFNSEAQLMQLWDRLRVPLRAVPGVVGLTPVLIPPFLGENVWLARFDADEQSAQDAAVNPLVAEEAVGAEFFKTFRMPLLRGRGFVESDRGDAPLVVVVSESVANRFWPGQDPIGKRVRVPNQSFFIGDSAWRTVVGVVADPHYRLLRTGTPMVFAPRAQWYWQGMAAVRTTGDVSAVLPDMQRILRDVDPDLGIWRAQSLGEMIAAQNAQPRLTALLLSAFGLSALVLAAIGLYGVMASAVRERTREMGVRLALGATPEQLRREVLARAFRIAAIGALIGLAGALTVARLMRALLFDVSPTDPLALAGACALLMVVALGAAYLPARRATRIDPAQALRAD
ncbi:MAG TPA: ABC transporter permease [Gemmatimonadaceae bacterium]